MTDLELIELLRRMSPRLDMLDCESALTAADRIEGLLGDLKSVLSREAATQERHDNKMEALEAKLAKATAVEDAFCEGFAEGCDGTWVEGDYTHTWKKSHALANLEETK